MPFDALEPYTQHFSYKNAQDDFYNALSSADLGERKKNLGLLLQSLGHVIHHVQDMGQPQHVRNDKHIAIVTDNLFEAYIAKSSGQASRIFDRSKRLIALS